MTELKHDPELPFVAVGVSTREVFARFSNLEGAVSFSDDGPYTVEVIDTTPKPKIPEDANYVFVEDGDQSVFAYRIVAPHGGEGWMMAGNGSVNREELLEYIGDAPVIVMIEKEDA